MFSHFFSFLYIFFFLFFFFFFFFFNDTATTEIYTLSLHDALPISPCQGRRQAVFSVRWPPAVGVEIEQAALLARPVLASPGSVLLPEQLLRLTACQRADTDQAGAEQHQRAGFRNGLTGRRRRRRTTARLRREHRVATRTATIEMK